VRVPQQAGSGVAQATVWCSTWPDIPPGVIDFKVQAADPGEAKTQSPQSHGR